MDAKTVNPAGVADEIYCYLCGRAGSVLPQDLKKHIQIIIEEYEPESQDTRENTGDAKWAVTKSASIPPWA